jgi:hypothetical protein
VRCPALALLGPWRAAMLLRCRCGGVPAAAQRQRPPAELRPTQAARHRVVLSPSAVARVTQHRSGCSRDLRTLPLAALNRLAAFWAGRRPARRICGTSLAIRGTLCNSLISCIRLLRTCEARRCLMSTSTMAHGHDGFEWSSVAAAAAAAHDCLLVLVIAAGERVSLAAIQAPVRQAVAR